MSRVWTPWAQRARQALRHLVHIKFIDSLDILVALDLFQSRLHSVVDSLDLRASRGSPARYLNLGHIWAMESLDARQIKVKGTSIFGFPGLILGKKVSYFQIIIYRY